MQPGMMAREVAHRRLKLFGIGAGALLLLASVVVVIGYLSAPHFYLTRTIFWGESDYKDLEKFPARTIHNEPPTSPLQRGAHDNPYASRIEEIGNRSTNASLVGYLDSSGTTAFLVLHDDELLYERYPRRLRRDFLTDILLYGQVVCFCAGGDRHRRRAHKER